MNAMHALLRNGLLLLMLGLSACATPTDSRIEAAAPTTKAGLVDYRCQADSDCAVKNVGNCCGYYPACVNTNSPTYPEQVRADCAREGKMAVCGFREISACSCNQGRCEAAGSVLSGGSQEVQ